MAVFRNREVKRFAAALLAVSLAAAAAGFYIGPAAGILAVLLCAAFCAMFCFFTKKRYDDIALLCGQINRLLHGGDVLDIEACKEGELSILHSEIRKMLVRLKEQSELLGKEKRFLSDSMADIAHQIRTPLTSINLVTSFLSQPDLEAGRRMEFVRELNDLLSRIEWLISSLLKLSKIDAGTAVFQKERVLVRDVIEKAAAPFLIPLELKNIALVLKGDAAAGFSGDLSWTSEAVGNILKNCMEHTEDGGVIKVEYGENAISTQISVRDTGKGIDRDDLPHIFERFYQGRNAKDAGFGVGLALSRVILSNQNASIKASNGPSGAVFTIKFFHQTV